MNNIIKEASKVKAKIMKYNNVNQVVKLMIAMKEKYKKSVFLRSLAIELIRGRKKDDWIDIIYDYLCKIQYVPDVIGVETIQSPILTVKKQVGDCDDISLLASILLEAIGIRNNFVIASYNPKKKFTHIYLYVAGKLPFDPTAKKYVGFEKKGITRKRIFYT